MKKLLCAALILAVNSISVQAAQLTKQQLPAKALAHFTKKHPKVTNLVITEKKHFGQALYELSFTEEHAVKVPEKDGAKLKEQIIKEDNAVFYRTNGHFFVDVEKIYAFNIIPGVVIDSLKAAFPDYKITAAQLVINPNGVGEEYEIEITSAAQPWTVAIDSKGNMISKENTATPASAPAATAVDKKPAEKEVAAPKKEAPAAPAPKKEAAAPKK